MTLKDSPVTAITIAGLLGLHGLRKKSLSPWGALTAFIVGTGTMAGGLKSFGVALIAFYLLGSRATKYGKKTKAGLEEGYQEAGYRSGWQVLCNSVWALVAAVTWNVMYSPGSIQARVFGGMIGSTEEAYDGWCAVRGGWSRGLIFAALGHFGCCLGDTLASELGILSPSPPRLVTSWKVVPPGTNGGMTVGGTLWSVVGGTVMGTVMGVSLVIETGCDSSSLVQMIAWGAFAGGFGSFVDSLMGATMQRTKYSMDRHLVLLDGSGAGDVKVISGLDWLTNNQVNLLSSLVTSVLVAVIA